ncbi:MULTISPECIES: integrase core domain-containing protein [Streptomyces violaceusniger group]|uniref:Integrase core domain-containing protein n=1 Tax=Streptomyces antimycoticus TaxID=68175 RepID=A0ABD5JPN4_9ACTN|nr:integrase core domain-containing protein [Streptomyces violaceusniger]MEE4590035.1 integrase core domain-containing protein [Streptomyces sp. DSM 41602]
MGYRRIHGELAALGIKVAASTVWEILREHGIPPAPEWQSTTWADFLRSQAKALLACDLFEVRTLTGARLYVFAVIEHTTRRIRVLGATAHPTGDWIVQLGRNLLMDLEDAGSRAQLLIRDRDSKFTAAFDTLMTDAGLKVVTTGIRIPRMNSLVERWIQTCRRELLDRTLIWNQSHLLHALREYESFYNEHRPHRALEQAAPCRPLPTPITSPTRPPGSPQTRPTRRNPPRIPARGVNCTDDLSAPAKYGQSFDAVFQADGIDVIKSAPRAPRMNAHCERVIGSIRREALDHILITNESHARHVLAAYQRHYNTHRPHRSQGQLPPDAHRQPTTPHDRDARRLLRTRVLGGVINEYRYAA